VEKFIKKYKKETSCEPWKREGERGLVGNKGGRDVEGLSFLIWPAGDEMTGIGARKVGVKS